MARSESTWGSGTPGKVRSENTSKDWRHGSNVDRVQTGTSERKTEGKDGKK
ncbi:hypothetical protein ACFFHJ_41560 [Planotetraspora thailandica]|nr:hypothetical protein [Planotetraspora thailandica]